MKIRVVSSRFLFLIALSILLSSSWKNMSFLTNESKDALKNLKSSGNLVYLEEDFEQGVFTGWGNLSDWEISDENPVSGNYSLKHYSGSGLSYIYYPLFINDLNADSITWRLKLKNGNWDPSSSNKFWFYLAADRTNLSAGTNGYAVGVNFSGSDDLLKLYRVTGGVVSAVIISSAVDWDPNTLAGIEVSRYPGGHWELKTDKGEGFIDLTTEGRGTDNAYVDSDACGLVFVYTSTRAGSLWIDDIYSGRPIPDTIAPVISLAEVLTPTLVSLTFSERVNHISALDTRNYLVDGFLKPLVVEIPDEKPTQVLLHFQEPFPEDSPFSLLVSGVTDIDGNVMESISLELIYESLKLISLRVIGDNKLKIAFSREISPSSAENNENYLLVPGDIYPLSAGLNPISAQEVFLEFPESFEEKKAYHLRVTNIIDLLGNTIVPSEADFLIYHPKPYDIVINEIMARPVPALGLPESEYIELYNKTAFPIDVTGWIIRIGSSSRAIPQAIIEPEDYLILCHPDGVTEFDENGNVAGVPSFPSVPDAGQLISLWDKEENVMSAVNYTDKWYQSSFKASGGWSLEQIYPLNPCGGRANWSASGNPDGGTPGKRNSVYAANPDRASPLVHRTVPIAFNQLRVFFSEPYHHLPALSPEVFHVSNQVGSPIQVIPSPPLFLHADLVFASDFSHGVYYHLTVSEILTDCAGNSISTGNISRFALPFQPVKGDLVINEVLFNPPEGGVDFVEMYNRSDRVFDLKDVFISSRDQATGELKNIYSSSAQGFLIFPQQYIVVATDAGLVLDYFYSPNPFSFSEISSMPAMNNDKGNIILLNKSMEILDELSYTEKMHYPLLTGASGVSLERVHYDRDAGDPSNWHSASQTVGFATPAYKNSQFSDHPSAGDRSLLVEPEVFSPDNDGVDDLVHVSYSLDKPGYVATVTIFDSRGRAVRKLMMGNFLGTEGVFSWDGRNDSGQMSPLGIYLILIDLYHADGTTRQYKKTCVLAGKLK